MLRITIELLPASGGLARCLGVATIVNDGSSETVSVGHYNVKLFRRTRRIWKRGRVEGFRRNRLGSWDLLLRALQATIGDRT